MQQQLQQRKLIWHSLIHGGQHVVFRLVSLVFSGASAWAIYWFFSALGDDMVQQVVTVVTSLGFMILGYFVTRGLAYRILSGGRKRSYILIAFLYIVVEVSCNFGHAMARYPEVRWIQQLAGWQFQVFSVLLPLVLSILPLFNFALAVIDVDLMHEKGQVARSPYAAQPKHAPFAVPTMNGAAVSPLQAQGGMVPQGVYPVLSVPAAPGRPNALKSWWGQQRKPGQAQPPVQVMGTSGQGP